MKPKSKRSKIYVEQGGRLVVLGEDFSGIPQSAQKVVLSSDPAQAYYNALEWIRAGSANPPPELLNALGDNDGIQLDAPPTGGGKFRYRETDAAYLPR